MPLTGPNGEAIKLKGERVRTLLVTLALNAGRPVSIGALTGTPGPTSHPPIPPTRCRR
jgi:hypothetical protein